MKYNLFVGGLILVTSVNIYAQPGPCNDWKAEYRDYRERPVGSECVTSKGTIFRRVSVNGDLGMQDMSADGKVWFDSRKHYWYSQTAEICARKDQLVPSKEDFSKALDRGLREAFHDWNFRSDMDSRYFWTSTTYAQDQTQIVIVKIASWQIFFNNTGKNSTVAFSLRCVRDP